MAKVMQDYDSLEASNSLEQASIEFLFPSPVIHFDWPESEGFNSRLKEIILDTRIHSAGVVKTNRGGWQSETNLQTWQYPEIETLKERIIQLAQEYVARTLGKRDKRYETGWTIRAWANVNQKGHFNRTHDHLGSHSFFSGVYYVDVGDIDEQGNGNGRTVFEDWTYVATDILDNPDPHQRDFKMVPKSGRMLLFPASLMHSVETYTGDRPRITIAFNLFHPGFAVARLAERVRSADWMWTNFRGVVILKRKIPEKLFGLAMVPRLLVSKPIPRPWSFRGLWAHFSTTVSHAFALTSERFEKRKEE
jgi:uncharacterized protein (TIGR02466 family)